MPPRRMPVASQENVGSLAHNDMVGLLSYEETSESEQARCDTLFLLDGNRFVLVRLIEISDDALTYRPCEAIFGAEEIVKTKHLSRLVMRNGETLTFDGPVLDGKNCVTLLFKDGRREEVLIAGREDNLLYYKPCNVEGEVRMVYLRDLTQIRDQWGRTEKIEEEAVSATKDTRVVETTSMVALGTSVISVLPFLILLSLVNVGASTLFLQILSVLGVGISLFSVIAGIIAVTRTGKNPTVYKGLAIGAIAIAIGLLTGLVNVGMVLGAFS